MGPRHSHDVLVAAGLALVACSSTSSSGSSPPSDAQVSVAAPGPVGKYVALSFDGPGFEAITFADGAHYTLQPKGCAGGDCSESGTYELRGSELTLRNAETGQSTSYPFETSAVGELAPSAETGSDLGLRGLPLGGSGTGIADGGSNGGASLGGSAPDAGASLTHAGDGGVALTGKPAALTTVGVRLGGQSFGKWKVGLYTASSYATVMSEQTKLTQAGAATKLSLYLNYADFSEFVSGPDPDQHVVSVSSLNADGIQLVMAFQPTNAPFCTHKSISATGNHGCRMTDLAGTGPNAKALAGYYAQIAAFAELLDRPLIFRFGSEMNADWDDWDYGYDKANNTPAAFVAAWEFAHHNIVTNLHKGRVAFAFAPNNVSYDGSTFAADIKAFWPGSANIDLIGLDGYTTTAGHTFSGDFGTQLTELEALGSQDLMLAEFACATTTAAKGAGSLVDRETWLDGVAAVLAKHPRVHYLNWFDNDLSHTYALGDRDRTGASLYARFAKDIFGQAASK